MPLGGMVLRICVSSSAGCLPRQWLMNVSPINVGAKGLPSSLGPWQPRQLSAYAAWPLPTLPLTAPLPVNRAWATAHWPVRSMAVVSRLAYRDDMEFRYLKSVRGVQARFIAHSSARRLHAPAERSHHPAPLVHNVNSEHFVQIKSWGLRGFRILSTSSAGRGSRRTLVS